MATSHMIYSMDPVHRVLAMLKLFCASKPGIALISSAHPSVSQVAIQSQGVSPGALSRLKPLKLFFKGSSV
jgi:hypothetical protein